MHFYDPFAFISKKISSKNAILSFDGNVDVDFFEINVDVEMSMSAFSKMMSMSTF